MQHQESLICLTFAAVASASVPELHRFVGSGGSAGGNGRRELAVLRDHVHLDRGVPTRVQDLARADIRDRGRPRCCRRRSRRGLGGIEEAQREFLTPPQTPAPPTKSFARGKILRQKPESRQRSAENPEA
eukprot:scaffold2534_cov260-Pinguiococcus_pyrenoidosus.AAC.15